MFWFTVVAVGMTALFWWPIWRGAGWVGDSLYACTLPQKQFLAGELAAGRIPVWNDLIGLGSPLLAESGTGVLYPLNLLLYTWCDFHSAYHFSQVLHYAIAFVGVCLLAKRLGIGFLGAILVGLVFVYGWFPARVSMEWPIVTGAWMPWAILCAESYLCRKKLRWLVGLAFVLGMQMLAGHFQLAFLTQLLLTLWVLGRTTLFRRKEEGSPAKTIARGAAMIPAMLLAFALAAVQLWPTWELLKQSESPREEQSGLRGHIPPGYLTQVAASWWYWHKTEVDRDAELAAMTGGRVAGPTNQVEAHLYFGLLPLLAFVLVFFRPKELEAPFWLMIALALLSVFLATGWPSVWASSLPVVSQIAPGRFGIIAALCVALIAGRWLSGWLSRGTSDRVFIALAIIGLTAWDLKHVARVVGNDARYAEIKTDPPINSLAESPVRKLLVAGDHEQVRVLSPHANLLTLMGVGHIQEGTPLANMPFAPAAYRDPGNRFPAPHPAQQWGDAQIRWLHRFGITHVLKREAITAPPGELKLVFDGEDAFLSRFLGRRVILYEVQKTSLPMRLAYPGWETRVGDEFEPIAADQPFLPIGPRAEYRYRPSSFLTGSLISGTALLTLLVGMFLLRRRRKETTLDDSGIESSRHHRATTPAE